MIRLESNIRNSLKNWRRKESDKANWAGKGSASGKREWTAKPPEGPPWKEHNLLPSVHQANPSPLGNTGSVSDWSLPGPPLFKPPGSELQPSAAEQQHTEHSSVGTDRKRSHSMLSTNQDTTHSTPKKKDPRLDINFLLASSDEK